MPKQAYAVVRYYVDQHYGGPEEGGWWYTAMELQEDWMDTIQWFLNEDVAWEVARVFNEEEQRNTRAHVVEVPRQEVRREYNECHDYLEDVPRDEYMEWRTDIPEYLPEKRPHYC